ncbi:hypothetical protein BJ165DRAFT_1593626 [Panaeolus papilionaceus]|nr:hypothetical protein BJ165DRAFT_1593626 [Panaeolus papilionaceus]
MQLSAILATLAFAIAAQAGVIKPQIPTVTLSTITPREMGVALLGSLAGLWDPRRRTNDGPNNMYIIFLMANVFGQTGLVNVRVVGRFLRSPALRQDAGEQLFEKWRVYMSAVQT